MTLYLGLISTKLSKAQQQHVEASCAEFHANCAVTVESADRFVDGLV
jgi:hypothetical protein